MCGIVGILSSHLDAEDVDVFKELMIMAGFRGRDSTGLVTIKRFDGKKGQPNKLKYAWEKELGHPATLIFDKKVDYMFSKETIVAFGHARAATRGVVSKNNAHPFNKNNVIGVHNGTILHKFKESEDFQTDSEGLYHLINEIGLEEALVEVERGGAPAYALAYFDKTNSTFNLIRNDKRPLWTVWNSLLNTIYFASEPAMIQFILHRRNIGISSAENFKIRLIPNHTLISFPVSEEGFLDKISEKHINVSRGGYQNYNRPLVSPGIKEEKKDGEVTTKATTFPDPAKNVRANTFRDASGFGDLEDNNPISSTDFMDYNGKEIPFFLETLKGKHVSRLDMKKILHGGCAWCNEGYLLQERNKATFYTSTDFLCEGCVANPEIAQYLQYQPGVF